MKQYKVAIDTVKPFLVEQGFTEAIDSVGNFHTDSPLFYKRLDEMRFLVFNSPYTEVKMKYATYDFWIVHGKTSREFLKKKILKERKIEVRLGFNIERDMALYLKETMGN